MNVKCNCIAERYKISHPPDVIPTKKPITVADQIAVDANGKRRFHGAFTGGFSAGFWNTVGSLEGWKPKEFKSSRSEKAQRLVKNSETRNSRFPILLIFVWFFHLDPSADRFHGRRRHGRIRHCPAGMSFRHVEFGPFLMYRSMVFSAHSNH